MFISASIMLVSKPPLKIWTFKCNNGLLLVNMNSLIVGFVICHIQWLRVVFACDAGFDLSWSITSYVAQCTQHLANQLICRPKLVNCRSFEASQIDDTHYVEIFCSCVNTRIFWMWGVLREWLMYDFVSNSLSLVHLFKLPFVIRYWRHRSLKYYCYDLVIVWNFAGIM